MKIAIIDFKSRFSDDVKRCIKEASMDFDVFEHDVDIDLLKDYAGFVFTGSPDTVYLGGKICNPLILEMNKPILGVCYGHQLVHHLLGGKVERAKTRESGLFEVNTTPVGIFEGLPERHMVVMAHDDEVVELADGFEVTGHTENCKYAATQNLAKKIYTVQFHPEDTRNDYGQNIYNNYVEIVRRDYYEENN